MMFKIPYVPIMRLHGNICHDNRIMAAANETTSSIRGRLPLPQCSDLLSCHVDQCTLESFFTAHKVALVWNTGANSALANLSLWSRYDQLGSEEDQNGEVIMGEGGLRQIRQAREAMQIVVCFSAITSTQ